MGFRAVHASWGTVFAHLPDLGCGQAWEDVWKVSPPAPITCAECRHPMFAKISAAGLRFFAHAPHAPDCEIARQGESEAHHLLKLELASAARTAGAHAELEVRAPDGSWRADVLASAPDGSWQVALAAQLAPITEADIRARTTRMRQHGVAACWFSDRPRPPWLGKVPSARVARERDGAPLSVVEGIARFDGLCWRRVQPTALPDFLSWVFRSQALPHPVNAKSHHAYEEGMRDLPVVWTHPKYIAAEQTRLAGAERERALAAARDANRQRRRENEKALIRERNAASRDRTLQQAVEAETAAADTPAAAELRERAQRPKVRRAIAYLDRQHGLTATVGWSIEDPCWAAGIPLVNAEGVPIAVLDPSRRLLRGQAYLLLAGLLLVFSDERGLKNFTRHAFGAPKLPSDHRVEVVQLGSCACATPDLFAKLDGVEYAARPSEQFGPSAALYVAHCRNCGCRYKQPWHRKRSARVRGVTASDVG